MRLAAFFLFAGLALAQYTPPAGGGGGGSCSGDINTGCNAVSNLSHVSNSSLANSGLVNPSVTIGGTSVALGGSTTSLPNPGDIGLGTPGKGAFTSLSIGSNPPASSVCTVGSGGMNCANEGTTPTGTFTGADIFWANSALHRWQMINNGTLDSVIGAATTDTLTNKSIAYGQLTGLGANVGTLLGAFSPTNFNSAMTGPVQVATGGTNCSSATITCFNNITGFTAAGTTGTTSSNLVFSASPTFSGTVTSPAFAGSGANAFINLPSNTSHSFSSGDLVNNAGVLQFNTGSYTANVAIPASGGTLTTVGAFPVTLTCGASCTPTFPNGASTVTQTIASGTASMGTGAISSGACASAVTVSATGVATTDRITYTPNGDPTGITGYAPSSTGSLYIWAYPTSGNVNFKVCNNTLISQTPNALTLNWGVTR